ncbi:MAG: MATE family efflux transporter [Opitutaceae bacterium]|nr:MATE family efflux transporter [Opitutaceae bacterium]
MPAFIREAPATLRLALPIIAGQVSQMLMGVTDSVMIGRVGRVPLAASAFANSLFGVVFIVGLGLLLPVSVLVARAHGARQPQECAQYLRHGLVLALGIGLTELAAVAVLSTQMHRFGQPPEVVAAVNPFFLLIGASLLPVYLFQALKQFSEALGRAWAPMAILLGAVVLNAFLNWVLIYGHLGAPALGLTGAGLATLVARSAAAAGLWCWLHARAEMREDWPEKWIASLSRRRLREMLGIGVPASVQLLFETGTFLAAALMMGWMGTVSLAAHQIALSCVSFTFMFPLGLATAVSMRVSRAVGEGRHEVLRPIGFGGLGMGMCIMGLFAGVFMLAGRWIAAGFTPETEVAALAAQLLFVAGIFQIFDGGQVIGAAALRGLSDVRVPTVLTFVAYWLVSLPGGYALAFPLGWGPLGIWGGLAAGLACAAALLGLRFARQTRPGIMSTIS